MNNKQKRELLNIFVKRKKSGATAGTLFSLLAILSIVGLFLGLFEQNETIVLISFPTSILSCWLSLFYIVTVVEDRIKINNIKLSMGD